jgi:hypothetical protein
VHRGKHNLNETTRFSKGGKMRKASIVVSVFTIFIAIIFVSSGFGADIIKPLPVPQKIQPVTPVVPSGGMVPAFAGAAGKMSCTPLQFVSTSPLPTGVLGGDYSFQFQASGGMPPYTYCSQKFIPGNPIPKVEAGTPQGCNSGAYPVDKMVPASLTLSPSGLLKGQLSCNYEVLHQYQGTGGSKTGCAGYRNFLVKVIDSCPSGSQGLIKEFWIQINEHP